MGRQPCCNKIGLKKGPWTAEEDKKLINFILTNGQCCWRALPKLAGLLRCGKSCRLRWTNYLRPDVKRGFLSEYEEKVVIDLHAQIGNRWSKIASHLPGRTDNEIKNHWNTHIKKKLRKMGIDPLTHKPLRAEEAPPPPAEVVVGDGDKLEEPITGSPVEESSKETDESNRVTGAMETFIDNDFSVEEIPVLDPEEILLPWEESSSTCCKSSSSWSAPISLEFPIDIMDKMMMNNSWFDDLDFLINDES